MNKKYSGKDLCVLVPTKDRPKRIAKLLKSLTEQTEKVGRIIIVASGTDIQEAIDEFTTVLPIDYYFTQITGQINQRNLGLSKIDLTSSLVVCIDDDIEFEKEAIFEVIKFWNTTPAETAGVGLNIVNGLPERASNWLSQMLFLSHPAPGRVLKSGNTTSISHAKSSFQSQWLNGGATTWRREVLLDNIHPGIVCKWSIAEDLIFSYPISKRYKLFVCAEARVEHHHENHPRNIQWFFLHGKVQTLWLYYFMLQNKELSKVLFFFTLFIRIAAKFIRGIIKFDRESIFFGFGCFRGIWEIILYSLGLSKSKDIREG